MIRMNELRTELHVPKEVIERFQERFASAAVIIRKYGKVIRTSESVRKFRKWKRDMRFHASRRARG